MPQEFSRAPISSVHVHNLLTHNEWCRQPSARQPSLTTSISVALSSGLPVQSDQEWTSRAKNHDMSRTVSALSHLNPHLRNCPKLSLETQMLITAGPCHMCPWLGSLAALQWQKTAGRSNWPQEKVNPLCSNSWMCGTTLYSEQRGKSAKDLIFTGTVASFYVQKTTCWWKEVLQSDDFSLP